ncbi:MAG TPA: 4Fe-4S dicluster domain-containing protein [Dysgonamonadaceae bacterium]|jgi:ferredoxin|nr:4Fe-4S dicluster domain-containing protein [Dysgonamonadaceae bacterium]
MLKKIRVTVSIILCSLITLYFLDFGGILPQQMSFMADIQFIPALLALNIAIVGALVGLTLLFGRIYCSSICPMGIYQDTVAWLSKKLIRKKRYSYSKAKTILRWSILGAVIVSFVFGFSFLLGLLDPYGAYGRIVTHLFRPAYLAGNNLLAEIFSKFENYTFYKVSIYGLGIFSTVISLLTLIGIGFLAWRNGRTYCNTVCPVGTVLGFIGKFSIFKIQFIDENCNSCGLCTMKCKASCINSKNKQVDYSRCVTCFNCIETCNRNALKFAPVGPKRQKVAEPSIAYNYQKGNQTVDDSKRRFLSATLITGIAAGKLLAQESAGKLLPKKDIKRETPIAPPGALSFEHLQDKCISCHLCISKCPSHVLKPAFLEYGLSGMMQPKMYFDHGFCNYDCTVCGDVCPTGAITKLDVDAKHQTQMGKVQFIKENCIVYYDETNCGACSEHCPTQAVHMVPYKGVLTIPETDQSICVGCGGCEYVCPAIPFKAIFVEGLNVQNKVEVKKEETEEIVIDDFGF